MPKKTELAVMSFDIFPALSIFCIILSKYGCAGSELALYIKFCLKGIYCIIDSGLGT